jgi:lambda repressor-like predicted transcriptional regulator
MTKVPTDSMAVYLTLAGRDFDPDECTRAIGLEPTKIWRQRHEHLRARTDLDNVNWSVGIDQATSGAVSGAVNELLDRVWDHREAIVAHAAARGLRITLSCAVRIHVDAPEYLLSADTIRRVAGLGAELVLDIFDYREGANG